MVMAKISNKDNEVSTKLSNDNLEECLINLERVINEEFAEISRVSNDLRLSTSRLKLVALNRTEGFIEFDEDGLNVGYDFSKRFFYVRSTQPDAEILPLLSAPTATRCRAHAYMLSKLVDMIAEDFKQRKNKENDNE